MRIAKAILLMVVMTEVDALSLPTVSLNTTSVAKELKMTKSNTVKANTKSIPPQYDENQGGDAFMQYVLNTFAYRKDSPSGKELYHVKKEAARKLTD